MFSTSLPNFTLRIFLGSLLLGNTAWAQQEYAVFINAGQEKVQCFPDKMTSGLIGESSLKVMTGLFECFDFKTIILPNLIYYNNTRRDMIHVT